MDADRGGEVRAEHIRHEAVADFSDLGADLLRRLGPTLSILAIALRLLLGGRSVGLSDG